MLNFKLQQTPVASVRKNTLLRKYKSSIITDEMTFTFYILCITIRLL